VRYFRYTDRGSNVRLAPQHMKYKWVVGVLFFIAAKIVQAASLNICEVPPRLPTTTSLGTYSPIVCFNYSGLAAEQYTLKVWLLAPGVWHCASSQWCQRQISIDNRQGTNNSGRILFAENMDVYSYGSFDWVLRLYNTNGAQVAFTERYVNGTTNRAPVLISIGNRTVAKNETLTFVVTAFDADGGPVSISATNLPAGAQFNSSTRTFTWTPGSSGRYENILFTATDSDADSLSDAELVRIIVSNAPRIVTHPADTVVSRGANATLRVAAASDIPVQYQWWRNGSLLSGATSATLQFSNVGTNHAGVYSVTVSNALGIRISNDAVLTVTQPRMPRESALLSVEHLRRVMDQFHRSIIVYEDISSPGNHFHARGKIPGQFAPVTVNGSWTNQPRSGATCIRNAFSGTGTNFGGFYFLNGILVGSAPLPYFGEAVVPETTVVVSNYTGLNLWGATALTFWARGEKGGEKIEFFLGGVGREPGRAPNPFPDSTARHPQAGTITLSRAWQKFTINVSGLNLTNVMGGFGWMATGSDNPAGATFYLDDIQYELSPARLQQRLNEPRFLRSFTTRATQPSLTDGNLDNDLDFVLRNTAFLYDNALALQAFLAEGSPDSVRRAKLIGDAMVYASYRDRTYTDGRLRTAYAAGDLILFPGWMANGKPNTAAVPGYYLEPQQSFFEVENRDVDIGNNAWAMNALLALYERTGKNNYLNAARRIGRFIQSFRDIQGTYQGFRGGIWHAESASPTNRAYASTEHNLDIIAAFTRMFQITREQQWAQDANHARLFVESMWDPSVGCYRTGTFENTPEIRNQTTGQLPLDAQSWNVLARSNVLVLHPQLFASTEQQHRANRDGFSGYDFNEDRDGVWFEGTAQMAVAYALSRQTTNENPLLATLRAAQQFPPPIGDGMGIVAASHDGVSSGFGFKLFRRLHVGATAWNVFAQLGFNPYYDNAPSPRIFITVPASNPFATTSSTVNLSGTASGNRALREIHWYNYRGGSGIAIGTTNWSINQISLQPGTNIIEVTAWDSAWNRKSTSITISRGP
jgi:hypothetical protein